MVTIWSKVILVLTHVCYQSLISELSFTPLCLYQCFSEYRVLYG